MAYELASDGRMKVIFKIEIIAKTELGYQSLGFTSAQLSASSTLDRRALIEAASVRAARLHKFCQVDRIQELYFA